MEKLCKIVINIFMLSVLSGCISHILPSDKYKKYVSFICGAMIILCCANPVISLFNKNISFDSIYNYIESSRLSNSLKSQVSMGTAASSDSDTQILDKYKKEIAKLVESEIIDMGYFPQNTTVELNEDKSGGKYCDIKNVTVTVKTVKSSSEKIYIEDITIASKETGKTGADNEIQTELKNKIARLLNIGIANITVIIKKT